MKITGIILCGNMACCLEHQWSNLRSYTRCSKAKMKIYLTMHFTIYIIVKKIQRFMSVKVLSTFEHLSLGSYDKALVNSSFF